jgi:hypothetical protein
MYVKASKVYNFGLPFKIFVLITKCYRSDLFLGDDYEKKLPFFMIEVMLIPFCIKIILLFVYLIDLFIIKSFGSNWYVRNGGKDWS